MSKKNQQMKIAVVAVLVILLISSIIAAVRSSSSQEPVPIKREVAVVVPEDIATQFEYKDEELELDEDMTVTTQAMACLLYTSPSPRDRG